MEMCCADCDKNPHCFSMLNTDLEMILYHLLTDVAQHPIEQNVLLAYWYGLEPEHGTTGLKGPTGMAIQGTWFSNNMVILLCIHFNIR